MSKKVGIIIIAVILVIGAAYWFQREFTITRMSPKERALEEETRRQIATEGRVSEEQYRKIMEETQRQLDQMQQSKKTQTSTPATSKPGSWEKTFQTEWGPGTLKYIERSSARGKILVWFTKEEEGHGLYAYRNISSKSISTRIYYQKKDSTGQVIEKGDMEGEALQPGKECYDNYGFNARQLVVEFYMEVK